MYVLAALIMQETAATHPVTQRSTFVKLSFQKVVFYTEGFIGRFLVASYDRAQVKNK